MKRRSAPLYGHYGLGRTLRFYIAGLFHVIPAWLLFVVLYVTGCETIDWRNMPLLSLLITSLATLGMS